MNRDSINQTLPNFRNAGTILRILLTVNLACIAAAFVQSETIDVFWRELSAISSFSQPLLLSSLLWLSLFNVHLRRFPYMTGVSVILCVELLLTSLVYWLGGNVYSGWIGVIFRSWLYSLSISVYLLWYFDMRSRALSPALTEARLQALQARIRPHFLFNSINAVLSLIRKEPKRAENALEDLADLFRVLMSDNKKLTTLEKEVELCKQYLDLEKLRLGDRLVIEWHTEDMPPDALIPPLVLQPLLENAVYHGIEPLSEPGIISIHIYKKRNEVHAVLRNPYRMDGSAHAGNKMALGNVRERLNLHFDAEASIKTEFLKDVFQAHIILPYQKEAQDNRNFQSPS